MTVTDCFCSVFCGDNMLLVLCNCTASCQPTTVAIH